MTTVFLSYVRGDEAYPSRPATSFVGRKQLDFGDLGFEERPTREQTQGVGDKHRGLVRPVRLPR
jgi:hypothetical protein